MELDDLKQRWQEQDRKLDALLRLNTHLLQAPLLGRAETAMRRLVFLVAGGLLLNILAVLWLGSFIADHAMEARFLLPAAVLDAGALLLVVAAIRQLAAIHGLDFGGPVVAIQRRLESLRAERIRATKWTLLAAPLLWIPLLIVILEGLLGVDAYRIFSGAWLAANVLFGLAVLPAAIWAARRYAERMARSPLVQCLMRDVAGTNLNAATAFLGALARFEREEESPSVG